MEGEARMCTVSPLKKTGDFAMVFRKEKEKHDLFCFGVLYNYQIPSALYCFSVIFGKSSIKQYQHRAPEKSLYFNYTFI